MQVAVLLHELLRIDIMKFIKLAITILFILKLTTLVAQPGGGGPGGGGDPDVPLGGIELLIAAGALYGAKKALDKKRSK